ncbi:MAG: hypothetical protein JRI91_12735 [Deltaproteobacteria bacterium]|nr:hypothetical protein [Deltaproteobacteria bacterium]
MNNFESVIQALFQKKTKSAAFTIFDSIQQFEKEPTYDLTGDQMGEYDTICKLNASFFIKLMGPDHPDYEKAEGFLNKMITYPEWKETAKFYLSGADAVCCEINDVCQEDQEFLKSLKQLRQYLSERKNAVKKENLVEMIHSVFFPEATGIQNAKQERIEELRNRRTITISELNNNPITEPARQILFTSNVLLTVPSASTPIEDLPFSDSLKKELKKTAEETQSYWYDHPIQIGVEPKKNEILYGLRELDQTIEFERVRGNVPDNKTGNMTGEGKLAVVLSVSVTHKGLQKIAGQYLKEELIRTGGLNNIDVYLFTEADTQRIINEVLIPFWTDCMDRDSAREFLSVFGVDGEYGRHYSFLKAIAAFWQICIYPKVKATFKIDLDQVFPQKELVEESGSSAFEHLMTPLWGAKGTDCHGCPVELGLIAGALVNEKDISKSLFTPDVNFPHGELSPDEYIFFNALPQALSTEAEMMTTYQAGPLDGKKTCIQRVHVTGGTNGILVDALRCYRPFTPSFIGRAEDQAYIMSVMLNHSAAPAYVHKDGLIMRHDKEAFAQEAIKNAYIGKLIGDYIRILNYSAYAKALAGTITKLKDKLDPFTGGFISKIPLTVVYLRFALKAASFFISGNKRQGFDFTRGDPSPLKQQYEKERLEWDIYYDILAALEEALNKKEPFACDLQRRAAEIVRQCRY